MAIKQTIKQWCQKAVITGLLVAIFTLSLQSSVLASTYGSGDYGACKYSQGCTSTGAPKTTPGQPPIILLNDFPEFFETTGKTLELEQGKVVYFKITVDGETVTHNITVKQIADNSVILSFAPKTLDVTLFVGQKSTYDVNGDGNDDIVILLNSIKDGKANLTFFAASNSAIKPSKPSTTDDIAVTKPKGKTYSWLWIILFVLAIIFGLIIFFLLWRRRRDDDDDQNNSTPDQTIRPNQSEQPPDQPSEPSFRTTRPPTSYTPDQSDHIQG